MILEVRLADGNTARVNTDTAAIEGTPALIVRTEDGQEIYLATGRPLPARNSLSLRTSDGQAYPAPTGLLP